MMNAREFYTAITNADLADELKDYAVAQIEKMDASNAKTRAKHAEKRAESMPYVERIVALLNSEPKTAEALVAELAAAGLVEINEKPITRQKISTLLRAAVDDGRVVKTKVKVEKRELTGYTLAE